MKCLLESIDNCSSVFVPVDLAFHAIAGTIIGESGDVDFTNAADPQLEGIPLPHAVDMPALEPFTGRLWFSFDPYEKTLFLENPMNSSGTPEMEVVIDPSGSPCRLFYLEPDYPLFQWHQDCLAAQPVLGIVAMVLRLSSHGSLGDVVRLSNLSGTSHLLLIKNTVFVLISIVVFTRKHLSSALKVDIN